MSESEKLTLPFGDIDRTMLPIAGPIAIGRRLLPFGDFSMTLLPQIVRWMWM